MLLAKRMYPHRDRVEAIAVSTHLLFRPRRRAIPCSAEELRRELADHIGSACSAYLHEGGASLKVDDSGIVLDLAFGEDGALAAAETHLSFNLRVEHVTTLCKAFRKLGWDF